MNFDHIELTMQEEFESFQPMIERKKFDFYRSRYSELILEGKEFIEADKQARQEMNSTSFDLTPEESEACLKTAKESKFYNRKTSEYFEKLKGVKVYPQPTREEFCKEVEQRIKQETGQEIDSFEFDLLKMYFSKNSKFTDHQYSFNKGILLNGPIGCGKTTLMKVFAKNSYQPFQMVSCRKVADAYKNKSSEGVDKYSNTSKTSMPHLFYGHEQLGWCFDDLGTESVKKNFGDELNVMAEIIMNWYDKRGVGFNKIHITTNLNAEDIEKCYGPRVRSRMREMFNYIKFDNETKDKRK